MDAALTTDFIEDHTQNTNFSSLPKLRLSGHLGCPHRQVCPGKLLKTFVGGGYFLLMARFNVVSLDILH